MPSPPGAHDQVDLADRVALAALAVPGVTRMHSGAFGEVSTYLVGRRVDGVRLRPGETEVHLVLAPGVSIIATAQRVRAAVGQLVSGSVDVFVEDLGEDLDRPAPHSPRGRAPSVGPRRSGGA